LLVCGEKFTGMKTKTKQNKINIVTLGCSKNLVDSEKLMGQLKANNLSVVHDLDDPEARTVVINTCGFIGDAKKESIDTILQYVGAKENGLIDNLFVMGCLSERYKKELPQEIPEIDALFGVNDMEEIVRRLGADYKNELVGERLLTTPPHYAYLKISEGCDRTCSFCAIPLIRGKHRSKTMEELVVEAKNLVNNGVKELILIAQDLTYYGVDIYRKQALAELLDRIADIQGLEWIRLHYAYPASFPKDVLYLMKERENICNYLDIPFQHISDNVLRNMRRSVNSLQTNDLISSIRDIVPDITLRTTLLVGHPGENNEDFEQLLEFVRKTEFDRLGVFTYSEEEGTYAANKYQDVIPQETKDLRASRIMEIQEDISLKKNNSKIGKRIRIIIDRREGDYWIGRSKGDSPEVDNEVLIHYDKNIKEGNFYTIEIVGADNFDLYGMPLPKY
jgi:ribosomal protein S12 methylthiotransferase